MDQQIERLIAQLKPKTAEIVAVRDELGVELRIYCAVYVADETPNVSFNPNVVAWAGQVGASIGVAIAYLTANFTVYRGVIERLQPGELSVVIAAAAPHRADAFEACRHAIEALKKDAPIWKREIYPDGSSWVGLGS